MMYVECYFDMEFVMSCIVQVCQYYGIDCVIVYLQVCLCVGELFFDLDVFVVIVYQFLFYFYCLYCVLIGEMFGCIVV